MARPQSSRTLVVTMILVLGVLPITSYWWMVGRAPTLTPQEARQLLADTASNAVLVDARPSADYRAGHLSGSHNWPTDEIRRFQRGMALPAPLAGKRLILICDSGWISANAALRLRRLSIGDASYVHGGMQEWAIVSGPACPVGMVMTRGNSETTIAGFDIGVFRPAPLHEQWAAVFTGFGVKPTYMLLSLVLAIVLWRRTEPDLAALRWGLIFFFVGEAFCAANYLVSDDRSYLFENLHSFGMVLAFGFTAYAVTEALDLRFIHYSPANERCAAAALCQGCIKHVDVPCGLRRVFLFLVPATMVVAAVPFCADFRFIAYNTRILGTMYSYVHEGVHQMYEIRFLPLVALALLAASWLTLLREPHPVWRSKLLYAAGLGALSFSLFRLVLFSAFCDNQVWFEFWEEISELLYVAGVGAVLLIFRRGLFTAPRAVPVA